MLNINNMLMMEFTNMLPFIKVVFFLTISIVSILYIRLQYRKFEYEVTGKLSETLFEKIKDYLKKY